MAGYTPCRICVIYGRAAELLVDTDLKEWLKSALIIHLICPSQTVDELTIQETRITDTANIILHSSLKLRIRFQSLPISEITFFSLFLGILSSPSKKLSGTPFTLALGSPASDNSCCSKPSITGVSGSSLKAAASDWNGVSSCSPCS